MADQKICKTKLANIPLAKPGFDALGMSAPIIVQMNPQGKWENSKPECLDEERLRSVIQHLVKSKAISAAQSYCCQCAAENKTPGMQTQPQYVPVVMMPIYPADQCPFDMNCEIQKMKDAERLNKTKPKKKTKTAEEKEEDKEEDKVMIKKTKKRVFQLQRLTDFDLLSQW